MSGSKKSFSDAALKKAVTKNVSIAAALRDLGLTIRPGNYRTFHRHTQRLGLDTSHFLGKAACRGKAQVGKGTIPLKDILIRNSMYTNTPRLKIRLLREGLLQNNCALCGINSWLGTPLVLRLDHINGAHTDHRIRNLRLLCPNCDSQQSTFCGRNC